MYRNCLRKRMMLCRAVPDVSLKWWHITMTECDSSLVGREWREGRWNVPLKLATTTCCHTVFPGQPMWNLHSLLMGTKCIVHNRSPNFSRNSILSSFSFFSTYISVFIQWVVFLSIFKQYQLVISTLPIWRCEDNVFYVKDCNPVISMWNCFVDTKKRRKLHNNATIISCRNGFKVPVIPCNGHDFMITKKPSWMQ